MKEVNKPNILYIFTDQQFAGAMSCAGNRYLKTPNMDSLAEKGVRFDKAYCAYPFCTPSRASMFTGKMPHEVNVFSNNMGIKSEYLNSTLGHVISRAGYDCAYGGKWHLPEINIPDNVYGFKRISNINDPVLADECIKFIEEERDKPFFLVASFDNPHGIHEWTSGHPQFWGGIGDAPVVTDCPPLPANHNISPYEPAIIQDERKSGIQHSRFYQTNEWRSRSWAYYRLSELVDKEIGKILDQLKKNNLWEDTLVIFSSDHGDMNGAHKLEFKPFMYEEATRIPFIFCGAGVSRQNVVDKQHLVSNGLDLFVTICDFAEAEVPEGLKGKSLKNILQENHTGEWRDFIVTEINDVNNNHQIRMVRSSKFKYIAYSEGPHREQLFHLDEDPGEMVNLANCSYYKDQLIKHRLYLKQWIEETNDKFCGQIYAHPKVEFMLPGEDSYPLKDSQENVEPKGHLAGIEEFKNKRKKFMYEFGY